MNHEKSRHPEVVPLGQVRRSQTVGTYATGSIVDLEKGSVIPLGIDDWPHGPHVSSHKIYEPLLQKQLGVEYFRLAPTLVQSETDQNKVELRYALPAVRFPRWQQCPKCKRIGTENNPFVLHADGNRLVCTGQGCHNPEVTPVRFVVACQSGHIDDFPWEAWAHFGKVACDRPVLKLESRGDSASLEDLVVKCLTCKSTKSLGGIFGDDALRILSSCSGNRPWLFMSRRDKNCQQKPRVLQRGASNVHFSVVASSLSIPPASDALQQFVNERWEILQHMPVDALESVVKGLADGNGIDYDKLLRAVMLRRNQTVSEEIPTESASRELEYEALSNDRDDEPYAGYIPQFRNKIFRPGPDLSPWFDLVGAVSRLREVRALAGFTRIEPFSLPADRIREAVEKGDIASLSCKPYKWLPAAEIRGEGIFLRFRREKIDSWLRENPEFVRRCNEMDGIASSLATERGRTKAGRITPVSVLVHSFAHAIIRQLSLDCGYSSSSLRERLYTDRDSSTQSSMCGVLVYTGSPDSDGSLGGLVRLADPGLLSGIVRRAVLSARWCGSDPVCLETEPAQQGERLSAAACHSCLLLPETSCELFNRELDRSSLAGDAGGTLWKGFFHEMN